MNLDELQDRLDKTIPCILLVKSVIQQLRQENQELRETVGRMQGLLNLQEKIGEVNNGKS